LPESLDETYERVLKEIKKPNRDHARRLLQCLIVAFRPLDVKELAEVLAVDFEDEDGIPKLKPNWRWEDEEQALLTSCSSLIAIVATDDSRVVQFSHFSVKEFLTSARLSTSSGIVSRYYIELEPAHTILAQACMCILLLPNIIIEENRVGKSSPLAGYAAEHWVTHAQFESVSSFLQKSMEYLFDLDKPYFTAWLRLHNIDPRNLRPRSSSLRFPSYSTVFGNSSLYYAALCGFQDLVEHLIVKYPQHVNTSGGSYVTPLVAAWAGGHFQTVKLLRHNGAHANVCGSGGMTPLHSAAWNGDLEMVQILLDYSADVNARYTNNWTPLHYVSSMSNGLRRGSTSCFLISFPDVTRLLLEHGADVNARDDSRRTPLHIAAMNGSIGVEVVRVLLEHGANVGAEDDSGRTAFQIASANGEDEITKLLSEHGAASAL
jgi:ankyrin repeat protein